MSKTEIIVRYAETDQMGIVHHSVYPVWFEAARTDMMDKAGWPYSRVEKEGIMLPLSHLECDYSGGAKYGETVVVICTVQKLSIARLALVYEVRAKHDDRLLASGKTIHAWTDADLRIINLKKTAPDLFEFLKTVE